MSESTEKPQSQLLIEETVELNEIHAATNLNLVKIEASVDTQDEEVFSEYVLSKATSPLDPQLNRQYNLSLCPSPYTPAQHHFPNTSPPLVLIRI